MQVAVLGTGDVGKALARGFVEGGHDTWFGTRDPDAKREELQEAVPGSRISTLAEAAAGCDSAVLCTNWADAENCLRLAGPSNLAGKLVIDVTNPLRFDGDGPPTLAAGGSAGEQVQGWLPKARVVKCWNIVGNPYMVDPDFPDGPPTMFIAGDDATAKQSVTGILDSFGWSDVVDIGGIEASRYLEGLAMVWIRTFFATGSGQHAFKLLRQ